MTLPTRNEMNDEQLLSAVLREEPAAQRLLYDRFSRRMFGVCLRYCKHREEAEDVLQEGFVKVFQRIRSFNSQGSLEGWIRRVIVNTALEMLRKQKMVWTELQETDEPVMLATADTELDTESLLILIQGLPAGYRTVFNLFAIEGYSHREIAEMMGITEGTSKSQYARARAELILRMKEHTEKEQSTANK
jgi:RNA polymerase sigma factor (sigma-70 family)